MCVVMWVVMCALIAVTRWSTNCSFFSARSLTSPLTQLQPSLCPTPPLSPWSTPSKQRETTSSTRCACCTCCAPHPTRDLPCAGRWSKVCLPPRSPVPYPWHDVITDIALRDVIITCDVIIDVTWCYFDGRNGEGQSYALVYCCVVGQCSECWGTELWQGLGLVWLVQTWREGLAGRQTGTNQRFHYTPSFCDVVYPLTEGFPIRCVYSHEYSHEYFDWSAVSLFVSMYNYSALWR